MRYEYILRRRLCMNQLWQIWYNGITEDKIDSIIKECEPYPIISATIGDDAYMKNDQYRRSDIRWVDPFQSEWVKDLLWRYSEEANRNAFGFDISYLREIQFTTYNSDNQGKYDWHNDIFWANPRAYDRKVSIIIQLSDSKDYEGGDFQFDSGVPSPDPEMVRNKGAIIVFPSFLLHRVTPVTKGTRKSLVAWVEGPKFR